MGILHPCCAELSWGMHFPLFWLCDRKKGLAGAAPGGPGFCRHWGFRKIAGSALGSCLAFSMGQSLHCGSGQNA